MSHLSEFEVKKMENELERCNNSRESTPSDLREFIPDKYPRAMDSKSGLICSFDVDPSSPLKDINSNNICVQSPNKPATNVQTKVFIQNQNTCDNSATYNNNTTAVYNYNYINISTVTPNPQYQRVYSNSSTSATPFLMGGNINTPMNQCDSNMVAELELPITKSSDDLILDNQNSDGSVMSLLNNTILPSATPSANNAYQNTNLNSHMSTEQSPQSRFHLPSQADSKASSKLEPPSFFPQSSVQQPQQQQRTQYQHQQIQHDRQEQQNILQCHLPPQQQHRNQQQNVQNAQNMRERQTEQLNYQRQEPHPQPPTPQSSGFTHDKYRHMTDSTLESNELFDENFVVCIDIVLMHVVINDT